MKPIVKRIFWGLVAVAAAVGLAAYLLTPTSVELEQVEAKTARLTFTEQGAVTGGGVLRVYPLTQGQVVEVPVEKGQSVRAGDVLCYIDPAPLESRISQVRSVIAGYEAQMRAAQTQRETGARATQERLRLQDLLITRAQEEAERAQRDLNRAELLLGEGQISQAELEQAQAALSGQQAALEAARSERAVIAAGEDQTDLAAYYRALIRVEEENLAQLQRELEHCAVLAGADGVISQLPVAETNVASAAAPVAEITRTQDSRVEVPITTKDVDSVALGDAVELILKRREGDVILSGTITKIHEEAELSYSALGLEERRVRLEITPDLSALGGARLDSGYDVQVRFLAFQQENCLTVPNTALFQVDGQDLVWRVSGGKLEQVSVTKGMELRTETVVASGLASGDLVVTDANDEVLKDGLRVKAG